MSGHSKWATIHRKKGLLDAARGKVFQKLAKEIMVAAKGGSPDPSQNASLRLAVDKAKAQNMPKENIQKAIEKATGGADGANFESVRYEGYGHREEDPPMVGEVFALYTLSEYYGKGVGLLLMKAALDCLNGYEEICLWTLKNNKRAIRFYQKCGFVPDGREKISKTIEAEEIRMILKR